MITYWLSSRKMTIRVSVNTQTGRIVDAAPIAHRFIGQRITHLVRWMRTQGGFHCETLH